MSARRVKSAWLASRYDNVACRTRSTHTHTVAKTKEGQKDFTSLNHLQVRPADEAGDHALAASEFLRLRRSSLHPLLRKFGPRDSPNSAHTNRQAHRHSKLVKGFTLFAVVCILFGSSVRLFAVAACCGMAACSIGCLLRAFSSPSACSRYCRP